MGVGQMPENYQVAMAFLYNLPCAGNFTKQRQKSVKPSLPRVYICEHDYGPIQTLMNKEPYQHSSLNYHQIQSKKRCLPSLEEEDNLSKRKKLTHVPNDQDFMQL